jgi:hypothetical protein
MLLSPTNYTSNKILDRELRGQSYTPPTETHAALLTSTTGPRQNSHLYVLNDTFSVLSDDGLVHLYKVTTGGTSAAAQSTLYPGTPNEVIADGTATMTEQTAALKAGTALVEPAGGAYARFEIPSDLDEWLDTQGAGGGVVSSGTSRQTSNVNDVDWGGASGAAWGFVWGVALYDADAAGNALFYGPLGAAVTIGDGDTFLVGAGDLTLQFIGAFTTYLANQLIDWLLRGQARTAPTTTYLALIKTAGTAGAAGTEVTGGSYARPSIASSMANWLDTQGAGGGVASTGTSNQTETENAVAFATPTADWGSVVDAELYDAASAGNRLWWAPMNAAKTILTGEAVSFAAGSIIVKAR